MQKMIAATLLGSAGAASAAIDTFENRTDWLTALGGPATTETFEDETLGEIASPTAFATGLSGGVGTSTFISIEAGDPDEFGFQNTTFEGRNYLRYGQPGDTGNIAPVFTVPEDVFGLGFDISGWQPLQSAGGPGVGGMNISLRNDGFVVDEIFFFSDGSPLPLFIGVLSDESFDEVRLNITQLTDIDGGAIADYVAFDEVAFGVPAPGAAVLLGLGGLSAARRRRP